MTLGKRFCDGDASKAVVSSAIDGWLMLTYLILGTLPYHRDSLIQPPSLLANPLPLLLPPPLMSAQSWTRTEVSGPRTHPLEQYPPSSCLRCKVCVVAAGDDDEVHILVDSRSIWLTHWQLVHTMKHL